MGVVGSNSLTPVESDDSVLVAQSGSVAGFQPPVSPPARTSSEDAFAMAAFAAAAGLTIRAGRQAGGGGGVKQEGMSDSGGGDGPVRRSTDTPNSAKLTDSETRGDGSDRSAAPLPRQGGGHNIPHYVPHDRVAEAGYRGQPFRTPQTLFHMPPEKTQAKAVDQISREIGKRAEPPYDTAVPILDGLTGELTAKRRWSTARDNQEGRFMYMPGENRGLANPASNAVSSVSVPADTPVRLSRAGTNALGRGGGEQVELRIGIDEIRKSVIFKRDE